MSTASLDNAATWEINAANSWAGVAAVSTCEEGLTIGIGLREGNEGGKMEEDGERERQGDVQIRSHETLIKKGY
jgi:hypothetical protein